jgi:hypothetical protein
MRRLPPGGCFLDGFEGFEYMRREGMAAILYVWTVSRHDQRVRF